MGVKKWVSHFTPNFQIVVQNKNNKRRKRNAKEMKIIGLKKERKKEKRKVRIYILKKFSRGDSTTKTAILTGGEQINSFQISGR